MNLVQDEIIYPEQLYSEYQRSDDPIADISESESQDPLEVPLKPGQRYGWWENHEHGDMHGLATIHGAVNDSRTRILSDTGVSVSIMSLDLARRLKPKLRTHRRSGLRGVTTYNSTHAQVKITFGWSVVYVLNTWVGNTGEGVDVLLGMNVMHSAGVRLCIREGLVKLPDEEIAPRPVVWISLCAQRKAYTCVRVRMLSYQLGMACLIPSRGKTWVTKDLYSSRSLATTVKVVNVSDQNTIPWTRRIRSSWEARYEEWQQLIHECTVSRQARMRAERLEKILRERGPPCTQTQIYQWPTKRLMRPQSQGVEVKMVKLQEKPKPLDMTLKIVGNSAVVMNTAVRDPKELKTRPEPVERTHSESSPEMKNLNPECIVDGADNAHVSEPSVATQSQMNCSTPVQKLEAEYARVMRVSAEELDLEPAVSLREGSDLMAQLRDQLMMLPEIEGLTPECNINEANVGVPGVTTPEMEVKMRRILKRHRSIFLGDGNAAQAPERGVVCDVDVGEAKPVALRGRQIAVLFLVKLLEAVLIEHSESEWSSRIVIVLKKKA
ncbi:hypothetical protein PHMEG_00010265 [Phytophthora megakarya]|uniref:Peptidase A2 domain-containing protein n=1 Tax=Phytophthora megakarya TaxID=4795 RepID=A0A225WFG5_9STRA|nr:hypothetical protein PHMEG_00010265 [Phytophthora megakarya]